MVSCNDNPEVPIDENKDSLSVVIHDWKIYNTENSGLPENSLKSLAVDNNNNLWIGTFNSGLAKFDGNNWTIYNDQNSNLPNNAIQCITVDQNNNIWIGTWDGLAKFDGTNWTVYDTANSPLPYHIISALEVDKNNVLWIGCGHATWGGLVSFDGNSWGLFTPENSLLPCSIINIIQVDEQNNKWIGTWTGVGPTGSGGLAKIDNSNNWSAYTPNNSDMIYPSCTAIATDLEGNVWIGDNAALFLKFGYYHGALFKFDGMRWTDFRPNPDGKYDSTAIASNRIDHMICDKYGLLWIATSTEWEFPYNLSLFKDGKWKNISDMIDGFPYSPFIRDLKIDKNGGLWLATQLGVISISYTVQ